MFPDSLSNERILSGIRRKDDTDSYLRIFFMNFILFNLT